MLSWPVRGSRLDIIYHRLYTGLWTRRLDYVVRKTWQQYTYDILHLYSRRANCAENHKRQHVYVARLPRHIASHSLSTATIIIY